MVYRKEIDGLRGIAVLFVIFYHAGFPHFSSGFIGVDIFFVISGYLITQIILKKYISGQISLREFYVRRALRILPMLTFMLFITVPFSWIWLTPEDLKVFGLELLGGITFISNFLDWKGGGYFATASELKPLMHLWSLSIEEQFYIAYPLILLAILKFFKKIDPKSILVLTLLGVIFAEVVSSTRPQLSFFLLPTRFWEFLAGGYVALIIVNKKFHKYDELLSLISFILLISALLIVKEDTRYPGFATLIPVIGTCGLIYYCDSNTIVSKLLKNKVLNIVGLSSFSSYLLHQPLFAFSRIRLNRDLSNIESVFAILVVLTISFITWKYIEMRYRKYE